jgi:ribosomal protein S18 acetylase RimI-like enzyme
MKCKLVKKDGNKDVYGYFHEEQQIGECVMRLKKDGYMLQSVSINEEYRGRGLCTKFLTCVLKKYTGTIFLSVLMTNEPAIKCYTKLGFEEIDRGKSTLYMRKIE